MPVTLTMHIDRSREKNLLRGRVGYIHSWILSTKEPPAGDSINRILQEPVVVVFVRFPGVTWKLPGLEDQEPGLYPITPMKRSWYSDKNPVLRI